MPRPRTPRRVQLGEFLAARRRQRDRVGLGLPAAAGRGRAGAARSQGLSREEMATLAGMSVSWYTWLEQGRDINASRQVIDAVARVLALTDAEREYVRSLVETGDVAGDVPDRATPAHLQRLIDALEHPAFIVGTDWAILGWNHHYEWLYGPIASTPKPERNLLWLIYTDPRLRALLPDWERDSRRFLAEFRAESGVRLDSDRHRALISRLHAHSADFRVQWAEHAVERFASRQRAFVHPDVGPVLFEHHRLVPSDATELHVVIYVPIPTHTPADADGAVWFPVPQIGSAGSPGAPDAPRRDVGGAR
ncbi:helix-turn-helix transcriptional regulator [Leucobacter japonicus]|uniref:helix-turn-helix transcriptional regulator n=1 Tax=Leucobacter japonicus TaxID=1461259 RepID=UPI0009496FE8|nr:helix-turn-helix transcriptional regulator [Leucobacter japonicus]